MMWTLPNILTLTNLLAGLIGIYFVMDGQPDKALLAMAISLVADYLDGMVARWMQINQEIGKDLDSLADIVSFGALPSFMLFTLLGEVLPNAELPLNLVPFVAFLFALFGALRLAKFNQDVRTADYFYGLPIPAAALYLAGLYSLQHSDQCTSCSVAFINPLVLIVSLIFLCFLMVSDLPHFHFKFRTLQWKGHEVKWIFLILLIPLAFLLKQLVIPFGVVLYIFLSLIYFSKGNRMT